MRLAPAVVTAMNSSGKSSDGISAGRDCGTIVLDRPRLREQRSSASKRLSRVGLLGASRCALELPSRLREEHIGERRRVQFDVRDLAAGSVERAYDLRRARRRLRSARRPSPRREPSTISPNPSSARSTFGRSAGFAGTTSTVGRPICALSLRRRVLGHDVSVVDDADAVGECVGLLEVLRREEHRDAVVVRELTNLVPQRGAALDVESGRRLVEEQDPRTVHECEREVEPALHPARVAVGPAVGGLRESDAFEQILREPVGFARGRCRAASPACGCARVR